MLSARAHGLSNGNINQWSKVIDGRHDFFQEFLRAEKDVIDIDVSNLPTLKRFMEDFASRIYKVMERDTLQPWGLIQ